MNLYFGYLLETAACLAVFLAVYNIFLRKETFFTANRIYLLVSASISPIIPILNLPAPEIAVSPLPELVYPAVSVTQGLSVPANTLEFIDLLWIVYIAGIAVYIIRFLFQIFQLVRLYRSGNVQVTGNIKVIVSKKEISPFSFFNMIFLPESESINNGIEQIVAHEKIHVKQGHTIDLVLMELIAAIQWFNPILILYKRALKELHEYIADSGVINNGYNKADYQSLILNQSAGCKLVEFADTFDKSLIKRRFSMMTKIKSSRLAVLKLLFALPAAAILIFAFSCNKAEVKAEDEAKLMSHAIDANGNFVKPDKNPEPLPSWEVMWDIIKDNIKMPEAAAKEKITGKIHVMFMVDEHGKIKDAKVHSAKLADDKEWSKKLGYGCDEEALRVVNMLPDWQPAMYQGKPVKMWYNLPIIFGSMEVWDAKHPYSIKYEYSDEKITQEVKKENAKKPVGERINSQLESSPTFGEYYYEVLDFISKNIKYPDEMRKNNVSGTVYVDFVIDEKGKVTDVKVDKGIAPALDNEALRVIKSMPDWKPGTKDGKPVKMKITIPISFKLK